MAKRQSRLPGMEGRRIKEIEDAADAYVVERDKRMKLTKKEVEAKTKLIEMMKKHDKTIYKDEDADPPYIVTLVTGKEQVKVTVDESDEEAAEALAG